MRRSLSSLVVVALAAAGASVVSGPASAADPVTTSFTDAGCTTWSAPARLTSLTIEAVGSAGQSAGGAGGAGDGVSTSLGAVARGTSFLVCVAAGGGDGGPSGGFNGASFGGAGGGASAVATTSFETPLLVAAGGGGSGGRGSCNKFGDYCGPAGTGGAAGMSGGGSAGTATAGGVTDGSGGNGGASSSVGPGAGGPGGPRASAAIGGGGGGGGGGYYGGGGGSGQVLAAGSGGGGGSDFCDPDLTCTTTPGTGTSYGASAGPGQAHVTFTYVVPDAPTDLYVDDDAPTGNAACTQTNPCSTIAKAYAIASEGFADHPDAATTIDVGAGTYTGVGNTNLTLVSGRNGSLTLQGAGATGSSATVIDAGYDATTNSRTRAFEVSSGGAVTIAGMRITGGGGFNQGGAVYVDDEVTATFRDDLFDHNSAQLGGALHMSGTGTVLVERSTFDANVSRNHGSAVSGGDGLTVRSSTFVNQTVGGSALYERGSAAVIGSTFAHNFGAIEGSGPSATTVSASTFLDNGTGIYSDQGRVSVSGSLFVESPCLPSPYAVVEDRGGNVSTRNDDCVTSSSSRASSTTTGLTTSSPLAANGSAGPRTIALPVSSSAFLAVPATICGSGTTDERGLPRPGITSSVRNPTGACTAGAFEPQQKTLTQRAPTSLDVPTNGGTAQLAVTDPDGAASFTQSSTPVSGISVASDGRVTVAPSVAAGTYDLAGDDRDEGFGVGTWSLRVTKAAPGAVTVSVIRAPKKKGPHKPKHWNGPKRPVVLFVTVPGGGTAPVQVLEKGEVVGSAQLVDGYAMVRTVRLTRGKHLLTVVFPGTASLAPSTTAIKVHVPRRG